MKIKIIRFITADETNTMAHLEVGKVLNVEDEVAAELVKKGVAQYEL